METDDYIKLQSRCFGILENISTKQLKIQENINQGRNVKDWDLYIKKRSAELQALKDAKATIDTILKHIDRIANLEEKLKEIDKRLKELVVGE